MCYKLGNEKKLEDKIIKNETEKEEKIRQIEQMAKTKKANQQVVESFGKRLYSEAERRKVKMEKKTKEILDYYQEKEIEDIKKEYLKNNKYISSYNFTVNKINNNYSQTTKKIKRKIV